MTKDELRDTIIKKPEVRIIPIYNAQGSGKPIGVTIETWITNPAKDK